MRRTYRQFCPLAYALDRVGERWTGLILRDLAAAPKRYTDLLEGLPGIGTSVLASRLVRLEDEGLVRRLVVGPPTPAVLYELTDTGSQLFRALLPLAAWGGLHMGDADPQPGESIPPASIAMALQATFDPARAQSVAATYEFDVDGNVFTVAVRDGSISTRMGPSAEPVDATIRTSSRVLFDVGFGRREPSDATATGDMTVEGDPGALTHCYELFGPSRLRH